jgi:glucose 1-dehydrogenase
VDESVRQFGRIDILVNNAGLERRADFWDVTEEDYDVVLNVNLKGPFFVTQAFVKHLMQAKAGGKVINISSEHEELPFPYFASYCASKGGIKMLRGTYRSSWRHSESPSTQSRRAPSRRPSTRNC